jgi:hypothetical protein
VTQGESHNGLTGVTHLPHTCPMPADTVTQLHPPIEHFPSCDRDVYGRAVMHLLSTGAADCITADNVRAWVRGHRASTKCACLDLRLCSVERQLAAARKAFRACLSDENAQRIADLTAKRDQLRAQS